MKMQSNKTYKKNILTFTSHVIKCCQIKIIHIKNRIHGICVKHAELKLAFFLEIQKTTKIMVYFLVWVR